MWLQQLLTLRWQSLSSKSFRSCGCGKASHFWKRWKPRGVSPLHWSTWCSCDPCELTILACSFLCQSPCILFHCFKLNQSSEGFARHFERIHTHPSVLLNYARYTHVDNYCHGLIIAEKQLYEKSPHLGRAYDPPQACRGPAIHWNKPWPFNYSIPVAREILRLHRWCNTSTSRGDDGGISSDVTASCVEFCWKMSGLRYEASSPDFFTFKQLVYGTKKRCASNVMMCQTQFVASRWVILSIASLKKKHMEYWFLVDWTTG